MTMMMNTWSKNKGHSMLITSMWKACTCWPHCLVESAQWHALQLHAGQLPTGDSHVPTPVLLLMLLVLLVPRVCPICQV
jgi:hypothetical protein